MKIKSIMEGDVIPFPDKKLNRDDIDELTGLPKDPTELRGDEFQIVTADDYAVATYETFKEAKKNIPRLTMKLGRPLYIYDVSTGKFY